MIPLILIADQWKNRANLLLCTASVDFENALIGEQSVRLNDVVNAGDTVHRHRLFLSLPCLLAFSVPLFSNQFNISRRFDSTCLIRCILQGIWVNFRQTHVSFGSGSVLLRISLDDSMKIDDYVNSVQLKDDHSDSKPSRKHYGLSSYVENDRQTVKLDLDGVSTK